MLDKQKMTALFSQMSDDEDDASARTERQCVPNKRRRQRKQLTLEDFAGFGALAARARELEIESICQSWSSVKVKE